MRIIVQKFGGSSLATPELRDVAASRVLEARTRGAFPVVVCSAIGRAPDPYATDTLLGLIGPSRPGPNRDLLLSCGESIACAIFAELLTSYGADAQAMTGAQAGIVTDETFGEAKILGVDPVNVLAAVERGIIPVVTGFQGVANTGATTTLGRGGSDLTAIALGEALQAELVDIYTDVSGLMTGDPRRIAGARTLPRVHSLEAVELAENGACVMHARGAELAYRAGTPYTIKGLRSNIGTTIDDQVAIDRDRPVTGIAVLHNIAFVHLMPRSRGVDPRAPKIELAVFQRLAENDVSIDMINVNDAGIFFICDAESVDVVKRELRELDLEFRLRPHCAKLSIVGVGMRGTPGVMYRVVRAVVAANAEIIHSTDSNITISILVDEDDAALAEQSVHDFFKLGQQPALSKEALA